MNRRAFLCIAATWAFLGVRQVIEGQERLAAIAKLKKRYPSCEILEA